MPVRDTEVNRNITRLPPAFAFLAPLPPGTHSRESLISNVSDKESPHGNRSRL